MPSWADKFKKKLQDKELASQEAKKSFQIYKDEVAKLYELIEGKVKDVEEINIVRTVVGHSSPNPGPIKALNLKCAAKVVKFVPEGINLDESRGRIRIEHNCKALSQFIYLHLVTDAHSNLPFPENLVWKYNHKGDAKVFQDLMNFDEERLEQLLETCFLE